MTFSVILITLFMAHLSGADYPLLLPHMQENDDQLGPYEDDENIQANLITPQTFYGKQERTIWINENGLISYLDEFSQNIPTPFENLITPLGPRLIAPFWADHGITARNVDSYIWYRETRDNDCLLPIVDDAVSQAFGVDDFKSERLFIVTWQNVKSFYGASKDLGNLRKKRKAGKEEEATDPPELAKQFRGKADDCPDCQGANYYQLVIITGENEDLYVMFNYKNIDWTTGYPGEITRIGFNSGSGETFNMDLANMTSLVLLPCYTNVGKAGRFMFKMSGKDIVAAGPTVID